MVHGESNVKFLLGSISTDMLAIHIIIYYTTFIVEKCSY